jgi:hypothetical protein
MIIDQRTYELQPGRVRDFLIGYVTTEVGNVNEIVHFGAYQDRADRTKRRAATTADPAWQSYLQKSGGLLKTMNNKILVPTSFSPTK